MKNNKTNLSKTDNANSPAGEKKEGSHKFIFLGLGALAVGALSYFGWSYWRDHSATSKDENAKDFDSESLKTETHKSTTKHSTSHTSQTKAGTKKPAPHQDSNTNHQTTQTKTVPHNEEKLDAPSLARQLVQSATQKNYLKTVTLLNSLKNTSDYNLVNNVFKTYRVNGVRQTLVNALLGAFTDRQKLIIKAQFLRIGLKHNLKTDKWTLSGTENSKSLITIATTQVWKSPTNSVSVPPNMVLGNEVTRRGDYTLFENEQEYYLVPSADIKFYSGDN
jgi:hypothetical protein